MKKLMSVILIAFLGVNVAASQETVFSFSEYLAMVKKHHPLVKQANLLISESEVKLLKARGAFDPKIEADLDQKQFKDQAYFNQLNASFKIPTWYGVEVTGGFENNDGIYLNPEATLPEAGLYNLGVSLSLGEGLLMNKRLASLKQAKLYQSQALADNQLAVNEILYEASQAYFDWLRAYKELEVYAEFQSNAQFRYQGVLLNIQAGEKPAIDSVEAKIIVDNRKLNLVKSELELIKKSLELSNFLWLNGTPVELTDAMIPEELEEYQIDSALQIDTFNSDLYSTENHPKLRSLELKRAGLSIEKRLKRNQLLPKLDVKYNFINENLAEGNYFSTNDYKLGLAIEMPIFFRKERANLRLANLKIDAVDFELQSSSLAINTKLDAVAEQISSYRTQLSLTREIVGGYETLLEGEEVKFDSGESSLFLINSRESKLIENRLKAISAENALLKSKAELFRVLGEF